MRRILLVLMVIIYPLASAAQTTITRIAALSEDETISAALENPLLVSLSDAATRTAFKRIPLSEPATAVALNKWGGIVYVGSESGTVTAFNTTTAARLWQSPRVSVRPIVAVSRWDDQVLAVDADSRPVLLSARTGGWSLRATRDGALQYDIPSPPLIAKPVAAQLVEGEIRILQTGGTTYVLPRRSDQWVRRDATVTASSNPMTRGLKILNSRPPPTYRVVTKTVVVQEAAEQTVTVPDGSGGFITRTISVPAQTRSIQRRVVNEDSQSTESSGRFPWPPPPTDAFMTFDGSRLTANGYSTFRAVDRLLNDALTTANYTQPVYLSGPEDGFIMLTRLENIDANGTPKPVPGRFGINARVQDEFSLSDFISIFLNGAEPGYYRIIAFAISKDVAFAGPVPDETVALGWLDAGESISLPDAIKDEPITEDHELTILVYEFEKRNKVDPALLTRGPRLPASLHLAPMGLTGKLQ